MITPRRQLDDNDLAGIADLEHRVVAHDGGRLKLEWSTLRSRPGHQVDDLLWWDGNLLIGFLGLYGFGGDLELAGMVDPGARRAGIGRSLLDAAIEIARERDLPRVLIVAPRSTGSGRRFAEAVGATLEHSEHHLVLGATPPGLPRDPTVTLRRATPSDAGEIGRILAAAFDSGHEEFDFRDSEDEPTLAIERNGRIVGTLRVNRHDRTAGIYGFAVDPPLQGQGIGRDALERVCREARDGEVDHVTLEVEATNDRALDLYLSVGFDRAATEDYFALDVTS